MPATQPVPVRLTLTFKTAADAPAKVMQAVGIAQQFRLAAFRAGQECEIRIGPPAVNAGGWSGQYDCEVTAATLDRLDAEKVLCCDLGTISVAA